MGTEALRFLLMFFAGWVQRGQLEVNDSLKEENRVLREQLGDQRVRFTNDQRRRLAAKGRPLGLRRLEELAGIVTPETLLRWYRELIAGAQSPGARQPVDHAADRSRQRQRAGGAAGATRWAAELHPSPSGVADAALLLALLAIRRAAVRGRRDDRR